MQIDDEEPSLIVSVSFNEITERHQVLSMENQKCELLVKGVGVLDTDP